MSGIGNPKVAVPLTGDQKIDGILTDVSWAPGTIYYSFSVSSDAYDYNPSNADLPNNFNAITAAQKTAVDFALNSGVGPVASSGFSVEGFTNLNIVSLGNTDNGEAQIRFGETSSVQVGTAEVADFPGNYFDPNLDDDGDVWFGSYAGYIYRTPTAGNFAWHTHLHEIGHALGLKHGHENSLDGPLPSNYDAMEYTVMTYRSYINDPLIGGYSNETWGYAQTYMMLDIAALQHMYGADFTTNNGNTVYKWNPNSGDTLVNGAVGIDAGGNRIFATIWDGGGIDTYDLSSYSTALILDLNPGESSKFSNTQIANLGDGKFASGNIYNALLYDGNVRSLIENAIGGSGDDYIYGNNAANQLTGNDGWDHLYGGGHNDKLFGGTGKDWLYGGTGNDLLNGGTRNDVLYGENGNDTLIGGTYNDSLRGGNNNDELYGGDQDDYLNGQAGNDFLDGGNNDDDLYGGSGPDTFYFTGTFGDDVIYDFNALSDSEKIDVSSIAGIGNWSDFYNNHLFNLGGNTAIIVDDFGNSILLLNVVFSQLSSGDFIV